jgi:hypothetical protein
MFTINIKRAAFITLLYCFYMDKITLEKETNRSGFGIPLQNCPKCQSIISALPGSRDSVCKNCGYKDPCCE